MLQYSYFSQHNTKYEMYQNIINTLFYSPQTSNHNNTLRFLAIKEIAYCLEIPITQMQNAIQSQQIKTFIFRNQTLYGIYLDNLFTNNPQVKVNWLTLQSKKTNKQTCKARTCYNHLAGKLGVDLYSFLCSKNYLNINNNLNVTLSKKGETFFAKVGINCKELQPITNCLDWTERRFHIGGTLGKEIYTLCEKHNLVEKVHNARALTLSEKGQELWQHLQQS